MNINKKNLFLENTSQTLAQMYDNFKNLSTLEFKNHSSENTVLIIVDVINGFIREGALHSERVEEIISPVLEILKRCSQKNIKAIAFSDSHNENSVEFNAFPRHCIKGESESEIVDELKAQGGYQLIEKNSTNGFHAPDFQKFIKENSAIENFIVCGDCTDICVMNFCLTLKTFFNQQDKTTEIIVPINMVETYDLGIHNADLMNITALQLMQNSGIQLVKGVDYND